MKTEAKKSKEDLVEFAKVMALALIFFGGILLWKENSLSLWFFIGALAFLSSGCFLPEFLRPIEKYWMKFAEKLSVIMTAVIVTLTFLVAVTPLALFLRLIGKKLIAKGPDKNLESYWIPVPKEEGPATRPFLPY